MWLSPLPLLSETRYAHARGAEVGDVTGAVEPDAEPDPGGVRGTPSCRHSAERGDHESGNSSPSNAPALQKGGQYGRGQDSVCRPRRTQEDGGGMSAAERT